MTEDVSRRDFHVQTVDGYSVALREVRPNDRTREAGKPPLILLHGTRIPGLSEYDLAVPNGSYAASMAELGFPCYILDARGFGRSQRPAEMDEPPVPGKRSLVRTIEITRDIDAAVDWIRTEFGIEAVAMMGWGVGGTCCIMYAALWPEKTSHIVLYDTIYGGGGTYNMGRGSKWEDPEQPGRFNKPVFGNYQINTLDLLEAHWDKQIPIEDKDAWRDPAMLTAFSQALLDGDPKSAEYDPPSYRSPNGMLEDLFYMVLGHKLVHACQVYCRVMIINPEFDTLCQTSDMEELIADLVNAEEVVHYNPPGTTHYVMLDRPERGRSAMIEAMVAFLS
ncbi:alpha/beta hydrolase [Pseudooceanicola sp.]|uniref:alpha/beta hydrolase n=1 Tax=Pseudooceanicola sp. TaxID=1914328 RepID=UPI0040585347